MSMSLIEWGPIGNTLLGAATKIEKLDRERNEALRRAEAAEKALEQSQELLVTCLHETGAAEYRKEIEQQCHENRTLLNKAALAHTCSGIIVLCPP